MVFYPTLFVVRCELDEENRPLKVCSVHVRLGLTD